MKDALITLIALCLTAGVAASAFANDLTAKTRESRHHLAPGVPCCAPSPSKAGAAMIGLDPCHAKRE